MLIEKVTLVLVLCHNLNGTPNVCVDEAVMDSDKAVAAGLPPFTMNFCKSVSMPGLVQWKMHSPEYSSDDWRITNIRCVPGDYAPPRRA